MACLVTSQSGLRNPLRSNAPPHDIEAAGRARDVRARGVEPPKPGRFLDSKSSASTVPPRPRPQQGGVGLDPHSIPVLVEPLRGIGPLVSS